MPSKSGSNNGKRGSNNSRQPDPARRHHQSRFSAGTSVEESAPPMTPQEIEDHRVKEQEREYRRELAAATPKDLATATSQMDPNYQNRLANYWESEFQKQSVRSTDDMMEPEPEEEAEEAVGGFRDSTSQYPSQQAKTNPQHDRQQRRTQERNGERDSMLAAKGQLRTSTAAAASTRLSSQPQRNSSVGVASGKTKVRQARAGGTRMQPGAVAIEGPGASSDSAERRTSAEEEVLRSLTNQMRAALGDDSDHVKDLEAASTTSRPASQPTRMESIKGNARPSAAPAMHTSNNNNEDAPPIAEMVDDAEPVVYAQNVRLDFIKRHKMAIGMTGCILVAIIVALSILLIKEDQPTDMCDQPTSQQSIPTLCYCQDSTQPAVEQMNADELAYYDFILELMHDRGVVSSDDYATYQDATTSDGLSLLHSCDPVNQVLLIMAHFELHFSALSEARQAPENLLIDLYVLNYMYVTMNGIHWETDLGWLEPGDLCAIHGLDCLFLSLFHKLSLPDNNLIGTIPKEIQHLEGIRILDLSFNKGINGTIPTVLAQMTSLNSVDLSHSSLSGSFPSHLGDLNRLNSLMLDDNRLTGSIPAELFMDEGLEVLSLSLNQFTGTIPTEIANSQHLSTIRLQSNQFSGTLPTELQQLTTLEFLNLVDNNFSGPIPTFLAHMPRLELIGLYQSGFTGVIPEEFCLPPPSNNSTNNTNQVDSSMSSLSQERRVLVVQCNQTGFELCSCCQLRSTTEGNPGFIQVECAETLEDDHLDF